MIIVLFCGIQFANHTNSNWSNVTPAKTDTNNLSLFITSRSMPLSTCDAHVFNRCGFTQMKIMSHFVTTTPLSSVIFAPSTRHFSKFTKFGPDTTTCVGFMIPTENPLWRAENRRGQTGCKVIYLKTELKQKRIYNTTIDKAITNGKSHITTTKETNSFI